jgi:hypothetical protein
MGVWRLLSVVAGLKLKRRCLCGKVELIVLAVHRSRLRGRSRQCCWWFKSVWSAITLGARVELIGRRAVWHSQPGSLPQERRRAGTARAGSDGRTVIPMASISTLAGMVCAGRTGSRQRESWGRSGDRSLEETSGASVESRDRRFNPCSALCAWDSAVAQTGAYERLQSAEAV